jgi:CheY-like chemotaxis protein
VSEGAERDLDAFAARSAHQLGEALALLRGSLLALEQRRDPAAVDALRGLHASAERSQRYVDDLFDVLASTGTRDRGPAELSRTLAAVRERLRAEIAAAEATVRAQALPRVDLDPEGAERLLAHAVRAALAAGAQSIEVVARAEGARAQIEVRDDAPPPGPEALVPFGTPRGRGALVGAGMSLQICARIVRHHGGGIDVGPGPQGGTVLRFTLPAARPGPGPTEPPLRVMLCDDVAELRALLRRRLEADGDLLVVGEAGDASAALRVAVAQLPDLIVLDLDMPGLAPAELLSGLARATPRASIVTYSGHEPYAIAGEAADAIAMHVPKTTDMTAVQRAVREVGRRRQAPGSSSTLPVVRRSARSVCARAASASG